jgi:hypothetical protein
MPTRKRNRTGSPKRKRKVERASDTGPCPYPGGSHAFVNSWKGTSCITSQLLTNKFHILPLHKPKPVIEK